MILAHLQNLPKNVGDLGKLVVAKGFKKSPKCKKSPTLVTLVTAQKSKLTAEKSQNQNIALAVCRECK